MAGEIAHTVPIEAVARGPGNFGPRDKKNRFVKRPRMVWVDGIRVKGVLEDLQMVYNQPAHKDSSPAQRLWRRMFNKDPVKFLDTMWNEEKRQLGYDEAAAEQAEELSKANKQVSELKAKVADLGKSLREKNAELTAKLLEKSRDIRNYRAVKQVEKLLDDFRLKTENERQQSVKAGQCFVCGQKLNQNPREAERNVEEPERRENVAISKPVTVQQVECNIPDSEHTNEPVNLTDEDRPLWRAYIAKIQRKQRPLNITADEISLCRKYGNPLRYINGMKN